MDLRRLRAGEWIAAASGAVLLASLFLPWYDTGAGGASARESLAMVDLLVAVVAAGGILLWIATAAQRIPAVPIALSAVLTLAAGLGVALVLIRAASLPDGVGGRDWGLWLAVAAAAGLLAGAAIAMHDERASPPGRHTDLAGGPAPAPPEIETIPAPRPQ
jgi:hypothetical protein